jgi:hypothetical protein
MSALVEFLLARIAEDVEDLEDSKIGDCPEWYMPEAWSRERGLAECDAKRQIIDMYTGAESVVRMLDSLDNTADPVGNKADPVALGIAQAALVALEAVLKSHAQPYADHPDYDQAWTFTT